MPDCQQVGNKGGLEYLGTVDFYITSNLMSKERDRETLLSFKNLIRCLEKLSYIFYITRECFENLLH